MNTSTSQILFGYWNEVRGKRLAPRRFEIEPARIGSVLPETFILERVEGSSYRFRLAGTRIIEALGFELRGSNFLDLWQDADKHAIADMLASLASQGSVGTLTFDALDSQGRRANFEAIMLPLVHTAQVIDRIVGSISCIDPPDWLGDTRLDERILTSQESIWPDGRPYAMLARGDGQAPFVAHMRGARLVRSERRQFRVYEGGLTKAESDER